jgi:DNA-binding MarR family transcriptional regulator
MKRKPRERAHTRSALHLLHRAGQCADELFAEGVGNSEITPRQFVVMKSISEADEPSQTSLVEQTGIDRSTMADIVRRLVTKGLAQRRRTREDARTYAVRLTGKGNAAVRMAAPAARATDSRILDALPSPQRQPFLNALGQIIEALGKIDRGPARASNPRTPRRR